MRRRWWPVSLRASAALTTALACAGVVGLGLFGIREFVANELMDAAKSKTSSEVTRLADAYRTGGSASADVGLGGDGLFEVVTDSGQVVVRSDNLRRWDPAWPGLPPANTRPGVQTETRARLSPGEHPQWREYRTYTVLGQVVDDVPAALVEPLGRAGSTLGVDRSGAEAPSGRTYRLTVYVFVLPWDALGAERVVNTLLRAFVPPAVLFVAAIAWFVTGRALRPVEAIRRELAEIGAHGVDRRVPVPESDDEIAKLARTTNETLDRLELSHRRQQQFVADASHELRSPLAGLRAGLEVGLAHPDRVDWPTTVERALLDVDRMQDITADLLLLASNDAGKPVPTGVVDLADVVREQIAERAHLATDALEFRCAADEPAPVAGHAGQLDRLLRNLLDNARRHAATTVTATVRVDGPVVVLEVLDDGPGIPAADRDRVFERFTRLDDARTRDTGGSGLGLTIARAIADVHGGTLEVGESAAGALLVARLPTRPGDRRG